MIVHQQMHDSAFAAGFSNETMAENEKVIAAYKKDKGLNYVRGDVPIQLKPYQAALEKGFATGIGMLQQIGANSRYFTDSGSKVPIDVSVGDAAIGMAIDFYGRFQAQATPRPGRHRADEVRHPAPAARASASTRSASCAAAAETATRPKSARPSAVWPGTSSNSSSATTGRSSGPTSPAHRAGRQSTACAACRSAAAFTRPRCRPLTRSPANTRATPPISWPTRRSILTKSARISPITRAGPATTSPCCATWCARCAWTPATSSAGLEISNDKSQGWTFEMPAVQLTDGAGRRQNVQLNWANLPDVKKTADPVELSRTLMLAFRDQYAKVH